MQTLRFNKGCLYESATTFSDICEYTYTSLRALTEAGNEITLTQAK